MAWLPRILPLRKKYTQPKVQYRNHFRLLQMTHYPFPVFHSQPQKKKKENLKKNKNKGGIIIWNQNKT